MCKRPLLNSSRRVGGAREGRHATPGARQPAAPARDAEEREEEEQELRESVPHELAIEVLERDVARELVRAWCEAQAESAVEEGSVAPVEEEGGEGGEGGDRVDGCEARGYGGETRGEREGR
ncbi:hypothetical protein V494_02064 [Pseudogymnoascus sp. VKM F-4513 (FW-928)]|nr:hypothetical protein V494_02064 [Pseudogymnoascus sp. VKM F-4513 (FW-928)]